MEEYNLKFLVTGGTGFVGSHIVVLLNKGNPDTNIALLIRDKDKIKYHRNRNFVILEGDLTDKDSLMSAMKFEPNVVVHAAALADDWASLDSLMKVNAIGTRNLIEASLSLNPPPFFVHISSSGVYKRQEGAFLNEQSEILPQGNYQKSKLAAEKYVQEAILKDGLKAVILRPPNVMGERDYTHMTKIVKAIIDGKFPLLRGGKARHSWVAAQDLAEVVRLSTEKQEVSNRQVYNFYSFIITVKELYEEVEHNLQRNIPPKTYPYILAYLAGVFGEIKGKVFKKPSTLNRYRVLKFATDRLYDDSKVRAELGFQPAFNAEQTISQTLKWLLEENLV